MEKFYDEVLKKKSYVLTMGIVFMGSLIVSFLFGSFGLPFLAPLLVLCTNLAFLALLGSLYLNAFTLLIKDGGSLTEARFTTITQIVGTLPYIFWNGSSNMKDNYVADIKYLDDMIINDKPSRESFTEKMSQRIEFYFEGSKKPTSTNYSSLRSMMMENFITNTHTSYGELRNICTEKLDEMLKLTSTEEYVAYKEYFGLIGLSPTDLQTLERIVTYLDVEIQPKLVYQEIMDELKYLKKYYKEMNVDKLYEEFHKDNPNESDTSSLSNNLYFKSNQHILFRAKYSILDTTPKANQISPQVENKEVVLLTTEELEDMYASQKQVIDAERAQRVKDNGLLHDDK